MSIDDWIKNTTNELSGAGVATARLDAEVLLADILDKDRAWVLAHPEHELQGPTLESLNGFVDRRRRHEPLAYIRGRQEFYGREFAVSPDTLTPRPETETMVELALEIIKKHSVKSVADIGTGSGCIAITLNLESGASTDFVGYEISKPALKVARQNAKILKSKTVFFEDDLRADTKHIWQGSDMIVANLPYVPSNFHINLAATHEPDFAIYGGDDGLDYYRSLFAKLDKASFVLTESLPPQHEELGNIAETAGYTQIEEQDFIQVFKRL